MCRLRPSPDFLAVLGDSADGFPGLPGWGAKSSAAVIARYEHLEAIPKDWRSWGVDALNPRGLSDTLRERWEQALLFRDLATLRNHTRGLGQIWWNTEILMCLSLSTKTTLSSRLGKVTSVAASSSRLSGSSNSVFVQEERKLNHAKHPE